MSEFKFSVTLAQDYGKGLAISYDGTPCEGPADSFAGITMSSGSAGDLVAVADLGSEIYFVNGGSAVTAGQPLLAGTGGVLSGSAVADGALVLGYAQYACDASEPGRCRIIGPESVRVP
jgi:hypothetical protein